MRIFKIILLVAFTTGFCELHGQSTIKGVILDNATGESLIGATIVEKGTTNGTVTDIDGAFQFKTKGAFPVTVVVQFIGYVDKEVVVQNSDKLTVKLASEAIDLALLKLLAKGYLINKSRSR